MANISMAKGTMTLVGDWTAEQIARFLPVLDLWEFHGAYGVQYCEKPSVEKRTVHFSGSGRWSFSGTLECFEDWARDWFVENPTRKGVPIHAITAAEYDAFLQEMHAHDLSVLLDFTDKEEDMGFHIAEQGEFVSDGKSLQYRQIDMEEEELLWEDLNECDYALQNVTTFFGQFLEDYDREKLTAWVRENVTPMEDFQYTENLDEIQDDFFFEDMPDPFPAFYEAFSPHNAAWETFAAEYEAETGECLGEPRTDADA